MSKGSGSDIADMLWPRDAGGSVREALRAWLSRLVADAASAWDAPTRASGHSSRLATSFENQVRRLHADAHAAFRSVEGARRLQGPDAAALDAALAVVEAEWRAALSDRNNYAEALKAIRAYAPDPCCRAMAAEGLSGAPLSLDRMVPSSSGAARFPFVDEFDD
jgi:hypothetical protein